MKISKETNRSKIKRRRRNEIAKELNALVVTTDLMGDGCLEGHTMDRHPFVELPTSAS